jgi:hypothetical protein
MSLVAGISKSQIGQLETRRRNHGGARGLHSLSDLPSFHAGVAITVQKSGVSSSGPALALRHY